MNEEQFRQQSKEKGYGEATSKEFEPNADGAMHTHDQSVMLLVLEGEFTLALEDGATTYRPGETLELAAGTLHVERTGAAGAKVIAARK